MTSKSLVDTNNLESALVFCERIANTSLVPQNFRGKPDDILVAIQMGKEVGLEPMQSLQSISVINGKPSMYGDALLALCRKHPEFEDMIEEGDEKKATCTVKRKGQTPYVKTFTIDQAQRAGLISRSPVWRSYPERMLQMRARTFALRDAFSDALKGFISNEEAMDYPPQKEKDITPQKPVTTLDQLASQPVQAAEPVEPAESVVEKTEEKIYKTTFSTNEKCLEYGTTEAASQQYLMYESIILKSAKLSDEEKKRKLEKLASLNSDLVEYLKTKNARPVSA